MSAVSIPKGCFSPAVFSVQDRPWQWSSLAVGYSCDPHPACCPGRNPKFLPMLELMTDRGIWEGDEMWYLADDSGLFVLFPASFPFLSYSISCFLFCMQQFLSLNCELMCVCGLLWRGLWKVVRERKLAGRSKSTVVCLYLEWEMVGHPQIIKKEWIPLLQRVRQHSSPWYLNYLFLVVKPGVTCLRLFSELEPKHVCVPSKKGMRQRGCSFIAELGVLKPLQGLFVGHISSPHTALDFLWWLCDSPASSLNTDNSRSL